jgi:hypothetical protein
MAGLRDQVRTLFKIRKERQLQLKGPKPRIGSAIYRDNVRMMVQAGMSDELWLWLMEQGWREILFKPDRRRYREVSPSSITALFDAPAEDREKMLSKAVARAVTRPTLAGISPTQARSRK